MKNTSNIFLVLLLAFFTFGMLVYYSVRISIGYDESIYLGIADHILEHGTPKRMDTLVPKPFFNNPPLVFYVASLARGCSQSYLAARAAHILVFGIPFIVFFCLLAHMLDGARGVFVSLVLLACSHFFLEHLIQVCVDTPQATFFVAILYATLCSLRNHGRMALSWSVAAGILTCLAALTNYQAVLVPLSLLPVLLLFHRTKQMYLVCLCIIVGGMLGIIIWEIILRSMGMSLAVAITSNVAEQDRFGLNTSAVYYLGFAKMATILSLLISLAFYAITRIFYHRQLRLRFSPSPDTMLVFWTCCLFVGGSVLFAMITIPPYSRYLVKCQPALILMVVSLVSVSAVESPSKKSVACLVTVLAGLLLASFILPNAKPIRLAGACAAMLGGVLGAFALNNRRSAFALIALILIIVSQSLTPVRLSREQIIGMPIPDVMKVHIAAGQWVQDNIDHRKKVGVLSRPTQLFCRRSTIVITPPYGNKRKINKVDIFVARRMELLELFEQNSEVGEILRKAIDNQFVLLEENEHFLVYHRK